MNGTNVEFGYGFLVEDYPEHADDFWEFHLAYLGEGRLVGSGFSLDLRAHTLVASPPRERHSLRVSSPLAFHIIRVRDPGVHDGLFARIVDLSRTAAGLVLDEPARYRIDRWRALAWRNDPDARAAVFHGLVALLHELTLPREAARPPGEDDVILRSIRFMEMNVQRKVSLDELADAADSTKFGFAHQFRSRVGMPPIEYFLRMKCDAAGYLLRETDRTSRQIAAWLGFSDEFHFSKTFKAKTGRSPRSYRQDYRAGAALVIDPSLEDELRGRHLDT